MENPDPYPYFILKAGYAIYVGSAKTLHLYVFLWFTA